MIDKLAIIKQILETDEETDKQILSLLNSSKQTKPKKVKTIHIDVRDCKRKPVEITADINTGKKQIQASTEDVSLTGAFLRTDQKINMGEHIATRMVTEKGEQLAFISEVVRVEKTGVGVLIKTISKAHKEKLCKFVQKL
jgi:hypothetical protein